VLGVGLTALAVRLRAWMSAPLPARVRTLHAKIKHLRSPLRLVLDTPVPAMLCLHPRSICTAASAAPILLTAAAIIQCAVLPQPTLCPPPKCVLMCTHPHREKRMRMRRPAARRWFRTCPLRWFNPVPWRLSQPPLRDANARPYACNANARPPNSAKQTNAAPRWFRTYPRRWFSHVPPQRPSWPPLAM
jgi:hypothetical protein